MKKLVSILIAMSFIYSCSRISEEDLWISADQEYKQHNYMSAIAKYQEIVEKFKNNPRADSAQYLIASIYNNELQEYRNAISEYRKLVKLFPNSQKSPKVMFLIGFIYNNQLNEYDSARIAYEEFIEKYPNDDLVQDAQIEIATLGKDPSELIPPEIAIKEEAPKSKKLKK